ncbi:hypothetical protein LLE87_30495, partial [Paenibacillus polymyxa]|nr:hypothetical protein [Paenibacillus polymyxa]
ELAKSLGQPVVVENKPGAGSTLGADYVAKAAPDGYTLVLGQTSNLAINPTLYAKLPYDVIKALTPVIGATDVPVYLLLPAASPLRTLEDIKRAATAQQG